MKHRRGCSLCPTFSPKLRMWQTVLVVTTVLHMQRWLKEAHVQVLPSLLQDLAVSCRHSFIRSPKKFQLKKPQSLNNYVLVCHIWVICYLREVTISILNLTSWRSQILVYWNWRYLWSFVLECTISVFFVEQVLAKYWLTIFTVQLDKMFEKKYIY